VSRSDDTYVQRPIGCNRLDLEDARLARGRGEAKGGINDAVHDKGVSGIRREMMYWEHTRWS
jgi:hypothetical protein